MQINIEIMDNEELSIDTIDDAYDIDGEIITNTVFKCNHTTYQGNYIVTPKINNQVLPTKNKALSDNITILEIPFYKTSNETGQTVYIGSEVGSL